MALKIPLRLLSAVRRVQDESFAADSSSARQADAPTADSGAAEQPAASAVGEAADVCTDGGAVTMSPDAAMATLGGGELFADCLPRLDGCPEAPCSSLLRSALHRGLPQSNSLADSKFWEHLRASTLCKTWARIPPSSGKQSSLVYSWLEQSSLVYLWLETQL